MASLTRFSEKRRQTKPPNDGNDYDSYPGFEYILKHYDILFKYKINKSSSNVIYMKIFSTLLGLFLGYIIIKLFMSHVITHGPDSNEIKKNIYADQHSGECYRLVPNACVCPI